MDRAGTVILPPVFAQFVDCDQAMKHSFIIAVLLAIPSAVFAAESTNYSITPESQASGGRSTSINYTLDVSMEAGAATASTSYQVRSGFAGAIQDPVGLEISSVALTVDEGSSSQLESHLQMDDDSLTAVAANEVSWSVLSGPLTGINSSGLATAGTVYQNTAATAQASYVGLTGTLGLTVLDTISDNFGSYAADGLGDDWQVQYFGQDNPLAAPLLDPDGDGQNNAFEFTAGLIPTNPLSRFLVTIAPVSGQPTQKQVVFEPIVPGRSYTVKSSLDLATGSWEALTGGILSDTGSQRTITDSNASESKKFYKVEIIKP
jgi:hypothetical protein